MSGNFVIRNCGSLMDRSRMGALLKSFDADAMEGYGLVEWTDDVAEARRFQSFTAAMDCWRQDSTVRPLRDDGEPNRPLTAFTIEIVPLDDGEPRWDSTVQRGDP